MKSQGGGEVSVVVKQGDNNTKFFQRVATFHREVCTPSAVIINREENKDPKEIKDHITEFYKQLYTESESWRPPFKLEAAELKDFRPISLIGGMYKIIAKTIQRR
ncbi:hypothetical protein H5410_043698 [Solanum commersonii]|uniref:Uncharacterized protein n=1 Tax=Solanum commersonii TaxID=4109 RepID=A0A9J5Y0Z0_SOLCO|nr:hypothetical protein H5410_043698 [Solanum commersonii]